MQAHYLALEGPDGSGKTTQMALLDKAFAQAGLPFVRVREPGGTPVGEQLRQILLTGHDSKLTPTTEALLFSAQRNLLVEHVVRPALADHKWVLTDRTFLTTWAFQGQGRGLPLDVLQSLTQLAIGDTRPHLMVIFDVSPQAGLARKNGMLNLLEQRFESIGEDFHARSRQVFLDYAKEHPQHSLVIDATQPILTIHQQLISALNGRYGLTLQPQQLVG